MIFVSPALLSISVITLPIVSAKHKSYFQRCDPAALIVKPYLAIRSFANGHPAILCRPVRTSMMAYGAVDKYVCERVRQFLKRRGTKMFS